MTDKILSPNLSDFDYALPKELIAQEALLKRAEARLLVLDRRTNSFEHKIFCDILKYFEKGDVLVLNDTKVIPARLFARRKTGGKVEILLLERRSAVSAPNVEGGATPPLHLEGDVRETWKVLIKPSGRVRAGEELILSDGVIIVVIDSPSSDSGVRHVQFKSRMNITEILERFGRIPLPPYIDREDLPADRELYQTVFARHPGAVASPTAGLHFDQELLRQIEMKGIEVLFVTLHVSYGTFQPVVTEDLAQHKMYEEYFEVSDETARRINFAKADGRRIIACGTTVVRTLESAANQSIPSEVEPKQGTTSLFVYPPYEFKIVDSMITNFHLPRTTLLMLTSAFAGYELLMQAYQEAIEKRYRFYSYGDATLIL